MRDARSGGGFGFQMRITPAVKMIMIINAALWFFFVIGVMWVGSDTLLVLYSHLSLHPGSSDPHSLFGGEIWQLFTYMWLHDLQAPFHLLFNLLVLFFFGPMFEERWGRRGFVSFLVICGIGAGVVNALAGLVVPSLFGFPVIGASGAVLGLIAAYATLFPDNPIYLWMVLPIKGKLLIPLTIGIDFLMFITQSSSVAFTAHLGGLLTGWLLITGRWRPRFLIDMLRLQRLKWRRKGRRRMRVVRDDDNDRGRWMN